MDEVLRKYLYKNVKVGSLEFSIWEILFFLAISLVGFMMRMSLKSVVTVDYSYFLEQWVAQLKEGGYQALSGDFYNYNPPYMVILYLISILDINTLTGIKTVSCIFDAITAITVSAIVMNLTQSKIKTIAAYGAAWLLPTVVVNGAMWAQCDSVYTAFIIVSIYFIIKEKPVKSMIFYGIAFGFKLQTIFILPAFIILWSKRKMKLVHFLLLPVMYFLSLLPAVFAGKSFTDTLGLYMGQAKEGTELSYNWPGLYEIFGIDGFYEYFGPAAMCLVLGILMFIMFYLALKRYSLDKSRIVDLFFYISMVSLYFLPHMHERYGYVTGLIAIIVGLVNLKKIYMPIVHMIASYGAYQAWLSDNRVVPFWVYSFMLLFLILDFSIYMFGYVRQEKIHENQSVSARLDNFLVSILHKEYKIGKMKLTFLHLLLIVGITVIGLSMRYFFKDYQSTSYTNDWESWIIQIREVGLLKGLSGDFYHATPVLVLFVWLISYLPIPLLYSIKILLVLCDVIVALLCGSIVYQVTKSSTKAVGSYGITMILPTIAVNSAMNGRFEAICALFVLSALYFVMKDKPSKGMLCYGIAFVLNLQALFVLPVFFLFWVMKKVKIRHFLWIVIMYGIGIVPALIAGKPFGQLGFAFIWDLKRLPSLSVSYPNVYHILGTDSFVQVYAKAAIWLTIGLMLAILFYIIESKIVMTEKIVIQLVLILVLIAVCFLPFMKESYGFMADVAAVLLVFLNERKFYILVIQTFISFSAYAIVMAEYINVPIIIYSFASLYLIFDLLKGLYLQVREKKQTQDITHGFEY